MSISKNSAVTRDELLEAVNVLRRDILEVAAIANELFHEIRAVNLGILAGAQQLPAQLLNTSGRPYSNVGEHDTTVTVECKRWAASDRTQTRLATRLAALVQKLSAVEPEAPAPVAAVK